MNYFLNLYNENEEAHTVKEEQVEENINKEDNMTKVENLKDFFLNAPSKWDIENPILRFPLNNGEAISCILWNSLFFMTGTDIVRSLVYRFECYGRPVKNFKKFEEGIFSDLRNLKPGIDAILEEPRSEFLEMLYRSNCIRTQKKQKVFFWYSVPHDRLFIDALERDLKRESMGTEPTTEDVNTNSNINEEEEEEEDMENLDSTNNNNGNTKNKRHPLAHSGIPKRVDQHLIYDNASLNPGNNNNILQQQRQLIEQSGLAFMSYPWEMNPFTPPQSYMLPFDNPLLTRSFMNYSPQQLFCNNLFQSPSLSDELNTIDMMSPSMDLNRNSFTNLPFDSPITQHPFMGFNPDPFLTMGNKPSMLRHNMMKDLSPYPMPPKLNKMNTIIDPNERPHVCQVEYCGRAFKRSDQLRRHHKTHEHPNPCPHEKCPRTFNRKDQLAQHLALHHPEHLNSKGEIITNLNNNIQSNGQNMNVQNNNGHNNNSGSETEGSSFTPELAQINDNDNNQFQNWNLNLFDNENYLNQELAKNLGFTFDNNDISTLDLMHGF